MADSLLYYIHRGILFQQRNAAPRYCIAMITLPNYALFALLEIILALSLLCALLYIRLRIAKKSATTIKTPEKPPKQISYQEYLRDEMVKTGGLMDAEHDPATQRWLRARHDILQMEIDATEISPESKPSFIRDTLKPIISAYAEQIINDDAERRAQESAWKDETTSMLKSLTQEQERAASEIGSTSESLSKALLLTESLNELIQKIHADIEESISDKSVDIKEHARSLSEMTFALLNEILGNKRAQPPEDQSESIDGLRIKINALESEKFQLRSLVDQLKFENSNYADENTGLSKKYKMYTIKVTDEINKRLSVQDINERLSSEAKRLQKTIASQSDLIDELKAELKNNGLSRELELQIESMRKEATNMRNALAAVTKESEKLIESHSDSSADVDNYEPHLTEQPIQTRHSADSEFIVEMATEIQGLIERQNNALESAFAYTKTNIQDASIKKNIESMLSSIQNTNKQIDTCICYLKGQ